MNDYHCPDIANSSLYETSVRVNCILQNIEQSKHKDLNTKLKGSVTEKSSTIMREFIEPVYEHKLKTDQYDNKYKCHYVDPSHDKDRVYSTCLGFECNTDMMYKLDDFNTYHNYPVCKVREDGQVTCCPENIQIFDNMTRRNIEMHANKPDIDLIVDHPIIPKLTYGKGYLYK